MAKLVSEVLAECNRKKSKEERQAFLKQHDSQPLRDILRIAFDDDVVSLLPEGSPPYQADDAPDGYEKSSLHKEYKKFKFFFKGGAPGTTIAKRESIFINLLETVNPKEAELLIAAKDKAFTYRSITKKLVQDTFPDLIKT
tara:strand:+ start:5713 stop:6135 length:423 start_codon:yes stop_codon:yes gene_type:complete